MTYMNTKKIKKRTYRIARSFGLVARVEGYVWVVEELHLCSSQGLITCQMELLFPLVFRSSSLKSSDL